MRGLILIAFLLCFLISCLTYSNNLIVNPSFEDWDFGWKTIEIQGFAQSEIDEAYAFDGVASAKVSAASPAEAYWEIVAGLSVEEGQVFAFSAFVRTEFVEAVAYFEDDEGQKVSEKIIFETKDNTTSWNRLSQALEVPSGASYLKIRLGLYNASGVVYWDQVTLSADENIKASRSVVIPSSIQQPLTWENSPLGKGKEKATLIQAETFVRQGGGTCALTTTHKARFGKGIVNWGPVGHWLEWEFTIPEDGVYQIVLSGATIYPKVLRSFAIDGKYPVSQLQKLEFSNTGGWGYEESEWANYLLSDQNGKPIGVTLKKGKHTVRMTSLESWINLDYIAFIK